MKLRAIRKIAVCGFLAVAMLATRQLNAQYLTLEGQTGGFLTPTAYVVYMDKGQVFSHPAIGAHFINAANVIGNIETFSITEAFYGRAEVGYTRSVHQFGNSGTGSATAAFIPGGLSQLWNASGMNVFHGKVVGIKDGQFGPWTPGVAVGGLVRTGDKFVTGEAAVVATEATDAYCEFTGALGAGVCTLVPVPKAKSYTNGDVYIAVTKTWAKKPVPFLANLGWKATNATIFGIGGQSTRFGGRLFGGLGIPLPIGHGIVAVPSAGFTQEPRTSKGLGTASLTSLPLVAGKADLPTTMDYAVRVTQRDKPHFAFDIGIGQVASNIGSTYTYTFTGSFPADATPTGTAPINLQAKKVVGIGLSYRY
ncbi:MAG: hypothetical protein ABSC48_09430 [Terracidiphilus sp.]